MKILDFYNTKSQKNNTCSDNYPSMIKNNTKELYKISKTKYNNSKTTNILSPLSSFSKKKKINIVPPSTKYTSYSNFHKEHLMTKLIKEI
jgi:hypothetical protein